MRGFLDSDHIPDPEAPKNMVQIWGEDVMEFANEIGAKQFYYTGVSHGTAAGWYIAFHQPHRLKALAAVSGVARHMIDRSKAPTFDDGIAGNEEKLRRVSWNTFYPTKDPVRLKHAKHAGMSISRL